MSLTASMWTSVSGLLAHGEKMNVIGNNISNVNTVGYRNQRMDFQDFVYQYVGTAAGMGQVGRGTSIGIVMNDFSQGALETTTSATDIAIQGNGFFSVKPKNNNMTYYTRAGNFTFDREGYLVDPHGYVLQGWQIDRNFANQMSGTNRNTNGIIGTGSPVDIQLDTFTCPPRHTTNMVLPINLRNDKVAATDDKSTDATDPFFALLKTWDATQTPPIGTDKYAYQSTMEVYDEGGRLHKVTIYFDRVADGNGNQIIDGSSEGESYWEYIITMDPTEDVRDFDSVYDPNGNSPTSPNVPDKLKGLLGAGTLTFTSSGTMKDMTAFVPHSEAGNPNDQWWTSDGSGSYSVNLDKWIAAPISSNGYPMFAPNFSGTAGQQIAYYDDNTNLQDDFTKPNKFASDRMIALDLGLRSTSSSWNFVGDPDGNMPGTYANTGLPTASGISRTYNRQAQAANGNLIWENGTETATAPAGVTPAGPWAQATPANNATQWTHSYTLTGTGINPSTLTFTNNTSGAANLTVAAANPPTNASNFTIDTNGAQLTYIRADTTAPYPTVAGITGTTWAGAVYDGVNNTYNVTDSAGNTLRIPAASFPSVTPPTPPSDAEITTYLSNAGLNNLTAVTPPGTVWNWTVGNNNSVQTVTTTDGTPPVAGAGTTTDNATEYYWTGANGSKATTTGPTAPVATAWNPRMETVTASSKYFINGMDGFGEVQATSSTCLGDNYFEKNGKKQDGYTYGDLRYVSVSTDGVLSAAYSNGQTLQLFQLVLYDFPSNQNLRREGGNLFTETRESGIPSSGAAGSGTFGTTHGSSLEQSNTDLSREFVNMITTQRGFQANSKTITTVDTMLETVIQMKR